MKLSEYPVGTTVELSDGEEWYRVSTENWCEAQTHCVDCEPRMVSLEEMDAEEGWKLVSLPASVVEALISMVEDYEMVEWHESDREEILKNAIESANPPVPEEEPELELEWKVLDSFEYILIEVNEKGQFRCNNQVFNPVFEDAINEWVTTVVDGNGEIHVLSPRWFVKQQFNKDYI